MNCEQARKALSRDLDGALDSSAQVRLQAHISTCAACRAAEASWREAGRLLRAQPVEAPPAEVMWSDVRRAIRQLPRRDEPTAPFIGWRLNWAAGIVAALFLLVAAVAVLRLVMPAHPVPSLASSAVEWVESGDPNASTMVYEDADEGVVVIWLMTAEQGAEAPRGS